MLEQNCMGSGWILNLIFIPFVPSPWLLEGVNKNLSFHFTLRHYSITRAIFVLGRWWLQLAAVPCSVAINLSRLFVRSRWTRNYTFHSKRQTLCLSIADISLVPSGSSSREEGRGKMDILSYHRRVCFAFSRTCCRRLEMTFCSLPLEQWRARERERWMDGEWKRIHRESEP